MCLPSKVECHLVPYVAYFLSDHPDYFDTKGFIILEEVIILWQYEHRSGLPSISQVSNSLDNIQQYN